MNEQELLENAAYACGYDVEKLFEFSGDWNPLEDDAQCFKLISDACISIDIGKNSICSISANTKGEADKVIIERYLEGSSVSRREAIRKASVFCAASAGEWKKLRSKHD